MWGRRLKGAVEVGETEGRQTSMGSDQQPSPCPRRQMGMVTVKGGDRVVSEKCRGAPSATLLTRVHSQLLHHAPSHHAYEHDAPRPDAPPRFDDPSRPDAPSRPEAPPRRDAPPRPDVPPRPDTPPRPEAPPRPDAPCSR